MIIKKKMYKTYLNKDTQQITQQIAYFFLQFLSRGGSMPPNNLSMCAAIVLYFYIKIAISYSKFLKWSEMHQF